MEAEGGPPPPQGPQNAGGAPAPPADPALDFLSDQFDALAALSRAELQPPVPRATLLDTVAQCRRLLPPDHPESVSGPKRQANEASRKKHLMFKQSATRVMERILASTPLSLEAVHAAVPADGPLALLAAAAAAGRRVCVATRHARGVRGRATGELVAYDRYLNVVLRNTHECYTVMTRVLAPARQRHRLVTAAAGTGSGAEVDAADDPVEPGEMGERSRVVSEEGRPRWRRKQDARQRQLALVFIKGDNIVSLSVVAEAGGPAGSAQAAAAGGPAG